MSGKIDNGRKDAYHRDMKFPVLIERVSGDAEPQGLYYASIPSLGLVTHGAGIEEAMEAARDLVRLWMEEAKANGVEIASSEEAFLASIEVA